jgi:photosystem II stability/assembly factor-like uncharacterized protein
MNPPIELPEGYPTWYSIKVPAFAAGSGTMLDFAVEPVSPSRIWVTNGTVVLMTEDSGCHWSQVYEVSSSDSRILEIEVAGSDAVYLPIQQAGSMPAPHVAVTRDSGATWTVADGPALSGVIGRIRDFDASLGNGSAAAMLVDIEFAEPGAVAVQGQQAVLTTANFGDTWDVSPLDTDATVSVAGTTVGVGGGEPMSYLTMNPVRPTEIWLYGENGAGRFSGGAFTKSVTAPTRVFDIALDGRSMLRYGDDPTGRMSLDGGISWQEVPTGLPVDSLDIINSLPLIAATGSFGRVFAQYVVPGQPAPGLVDLSPIDGRPISDLQVGFPENGQDPSIYGRGYNTIEVLYEAQGRPVKANEVRASLVEPPPLTATNTLSPPYKKIRMHPGDEATIPYALNLPAAVTDLDVYFMIDISGSMQNTINGIRSAMQDIADRLRKEIGNEVHFGVGSFRSYDTPPPYKRNRDIGPPGPELAAALNELHASGGGDETQMAALLQSVTGEGDIGIPVGSNMHFRPGSLRVAIEVTDELISQGGPHPSYATVIDALNKHNVRQVGLAIQEPPLLGEDDYENPGGPAQGLQTVAEGTGAVAPPTGVDCDGDGEIELQPEDPLVCMIDPARANEASYMADAIVNIVKSLEDIQDLTVTATPKADPSAESPVLVGISPDVLPRRDLKEPTSGQFEVAVRCPHVDRTTTYPTAIEVFRPGRPVASADLDVTCVPIIKEERPPLIAAFVPVAAVPPPPPRPPDPIPEPNPNPQPNPQGNPQTGFASQEQQQPQVALAGQEGEPVADVADEGVSDEYFMRDNSESRVPPVGFIFTAGAISAAGGYVLLTNKRPRTAHARNRRDRRP